VLGVQGGTRSCGLRRFDRRSVAGLAVVLAGSDGPARSGCRARARHLRASVSSAVVPQSDDRCLPAVARLRPPSSPATTSPGPLPFDRRSRGCPCSSEPVCTRPACSGGSPPAPSGRSSLSLPSLREPFELPHSVLSSGLHPYPRTGAPVDWSSAAMPLRSRSLPTLFSFGPSPPEGS